MLSNVRLTSEEKIYNQKTVADARLTMQVGHRARNEGLYFVTQLILQRQQVDLHLNFPIS